MNSTKPRDTEEIERDIHARNVLWHEQNQSSASAMDRVNAAWKRTVTVQGISLDLPEFYDVIKSGPIKIGDLVYNAGEERFDTIESETKPLWYTDAVQAEMCHLVLRLPGQWTIDEMTRMKAFAEGYIAASPDSPCCFDRWITFAEDIDIHFRTNDDEEATTFGEIEAWGYRRNERPEIGDRDCTDEVKLI